LTPEGENAFATATLGTPATAWIRLMLPTLTRTHRPATDLGFMLRKHPERPLGFDVGVGAIAVPGGQPT